MSTPAQKKAIKEFKNVTDASDKVAQEVLTKSNWNLETALDSFFANRSQYPEGKKGDTKKLSKVFDQYADAESKDELSGENLVKFLHEIDVDPSKPESFAVCWKLHCKEIGVITRREFTEGFANMGADSTAKIKSEMERVKKMLQDSDTFKQMYCWLFDYMAEGKRSLAKEVALQLWKTLLGHSWGLTAKWIEFAEDDKKSGLKSISKDVWTQVYEFSRDVRADLSNYDADNGAWPAVLDDFVVFVKGK